MRQENVIVETWRLQTKTVDGYFWMHKTKRDRGVLIRSERMQYDPDNVRRDLKEATDVDLRKFSVQVRI